MTVAMRVSRDENGVPVLDRARRAIANIESAGSGDYAAIGPLTQQGDRAYGRYQVMGANIPAWTQEALGKRLTPKQFLADPAAQDAVFNHFFSKFMAQTGSPQDAASMWFTGKPLARARGRQDVLGTKAEQYVARFTEEFANPSVNPGTASASSSMLPGSVPPVPGSMLDTELGGGLGGRSFPLPSVESPSITPPAFSGIADLTGGELGKVLAMPRSSLLRG